MEGEKKSLLKSSRCLAHLWLIDGLTRWEDHPGVVSRKDGALMGSDEEVCLECLPVMRAATRHHQQTAGLG